MFRPPEEPSVSQVAKELWVELDRVEGNLEVIRADLASVFADLHGQMPTPPGARIDVAGPPALPRAPPLPRLDRLPRAEPQRAGRMAGKKGRSFSATRHR
jgi:hypothetical protein